MDKEQIAKIFEEIGTTLELKGENPFKTRAYFNAARTLLNLEEELDILIEENRLTELEGIGKDLATKITTLFNTGTLPEFEKLKETVPAGLFDLMKIPGLGGKKIKTLFETLNITSIPTLKEACLAGKVAQIPRFGEKTQKNILDGIAHLESYNKRYLWWDAINIATPLLEQLRKIKGVKTAEIAGSVRRKLETIGDLDFVVAAAHSKPVMDWFTSLPQAEAVISHGTAKSSIRLQDGMQAELRVVPDDQFAFTLLYSTGSKLHSIKLRQIANEHGLTLSEWGLVPEKNSTAKNPFAHSKKKITEEDIYKALGLEYIHPELREDMGEIEAAKKGKLPHLVELKDMKGAFHVHTAASDGRNTLEAMVKGAEDLGWEYIGITDHSKSSFQANGLSEERLMEQFQHIQKLNKSKKFKTHIFSGVECDILKDGTLDFADDILKQLDFVVISVHASMQQDEQTMTKRLIRAIENPYATIVGHVSGRLLLKREAYALNFDKVIDACIANGKIVELNANPWRLDMDWRQWHKAANKGLKCCINPDAHSVEGLQVISAGVNVARKGWLEKKDVINTLPLNKIKELLKK